MAKTSTERSKDKRDKALKQGLVRLPERHVRPEHKAKILAFIDRLSRSTAGLGQDKRMMDMAADRSKEVAAHAAADAAIERADKMNFYTVGKLLTDSICNAQWIADEEAYRLCKVAHKYGPPWARRKYMECAIFYNPFTIAA